MRATTRLHARRRHQRDSRRHHNANGIAEWYSMPVDHERNIEIHACLFILNTFRLPQRTLLVMRACLPRLAQAERHRRAVCHMRFMQRRSFATRWFGASAGAAR